MATAHLIHGYLGSGKTTFAKALEKETAALRFTHDEGMKKLYGDDPAEEHFADYANRVSEVMEGLWTRCLQIGADVILDSGFWSRNERDRVRLTVASLGADCRLYRLSCSEDEPWKRIETRNLSLDSSLYIAPSTFEMLTAGIEPLSDDESRIEMSQKSCDLSRKAQRGEFSMGPMPDGTHAHECACRTKGRVGRDGGDMQGMYAARNSGGLMSMSMRCGPSRSGLNWRPNDRIDEMEQVACREGARAMRD